MARTSGITSQPDVRGTSAVENKQESIVRARILSNYSATTAGTASAPDASNATIFGQLQRPRVTDATRRVVRDADKPRADLSDLPILGLEKWQARVVEVTDSVFTAEMEDEHGPPLLVDFPLDLLGPDRALVPGDAVYVTVRTVRDRFDYPARTTAVRLRRLGNWSEQELDRIRSSAQSRAARLAALAD